jgi:protein-disulfide isomerase
VRFVYRHMAFLGNESVAAAAASECADEQGRFWDYHDVLFNHTAGRDKGVFTTPQLEQYGADIGLEPQAFNSCVASGRYDDWVRAQTDQGRREGVTSTPTLVVNGRHIAPVGSFEELRDLLLASAKGVETSPSPSGRGPG